MRKNRTIIKESQLRRIVKESVKRILKEEIGDGSFPNAQSLVDKDVESVNKSLVMAGFELNEYGDEDQMGRFGYSSYVNNETEQEVKIIYPFNSFNGGKSVRAGKIVRAEVYNDLIYHEKPYDIATSKCWDGHTGKY